MFTYTLQLFDLLVYERVGLFLAFFITSWTIHFIRLGASTRNPLKGIKTGGINGIKLSAIIPVVDEPMDVWMRTIQGIKRAMKPFGKKPEIFVVANGNNGHEAIAYAEKEGCKVLRLENAGKRKALQYGLSKVTGDITIILDSDTYVLEDSIKNLIRVFKDQNVGGATPKHVIYAYNKNIWRRISNWLEDIRFGEIVTGQSSFGSVSCLPGRLMAVRTPLLRRMIVDLAHQRFLGADCISGDDRFITSEILRRGYKTVYVPESVVLTEAPDTLKRFVQQRLRWSRTSLRETLRSIPWTLKRKYMTFTVFTTLIMRWFFLAVVVNAFLNWFEFIQVPHYLNLGTPAVVVFTILGFLLSGLVKQIRHLIVYPQDFKYLPLFLFVTTFILTPVEWFGNLTLRESGWMTRNVD